MKTLTAALLLLVAAACGPVEQQDKAGSQSAETEAAAPPAAPAAPAVDPAAIEALTRMSAYLRTLQTFEVRAVTSRDEVLNDTEQKVMFDGNGLYQIRRPNAFYLEANTDRRQRRYYYDGTTFTIYSPRMDVYAQRPAPGTIREMVDQMQDRYNIPVPLADLFYWGTEPVPNDLELASVIGPARINNQDTMQYAFRRGDIDWQVWIAKGDRPLPLKVVITTRSDPERPQYTSVLTWNTNAHFAPTTFAFRPPSGAHEIQIAEAQTQSEAQTQ